ncbi:hypothetical protein Pcinc_005912 [Petrolisthes cinctipes]|uniref:Uncharacterized protein n=1 Tax=Petrolisthes cinctipes TaxID=88211 RepID=A0AAE1GDY6_PETCI|nr:hypothetical protein Pcinc_005912 [Petrolisthes cinctipes]
MQSKSVSHGRKKAGASPLVAGNGLLGDFIQPLCDACPELVVLELSQFMGREENMASSLASSSSPASLGLNLPSGKIDQDKNGEWGTSTSSSAADQGRNDEWRSCTLIANSSPSNLGCNLPSNPYEQSRNEEWRSSTVTLNSSSATSGLVVPSGATKRAKNEEDWGKTKAKKLRNLGMAYESRNTHKLMEARKVGPPCSCQVRCFDILGMNNIKLLFHAFWDIGDYNLQNAYIQNQVSVCPTKRRTTSDPDKMRNNMKQFFVTVRGIKVPVCKHAFLSVHGLSRCRVDTACIKKRTENGIPLIDNRGKAGTHQQISTERLAAVIEYVQTIPTVKDHESHETSSNVEYVSPEVKSKQQLYDMYKSWLTEKYPTMECVTNHYFLDVLKRYFSNLRFIKPRKGDSSAADPCVTSLDSERCAQMGS